MSDVPSNIQQMYYATCPDCSNWWFAILVALIGCIIVALIILVREW